MHKIITLLITLICGVSFAHEHSEVNLLIGEIHNGSGLIGIEVTLKDGWYTYYKEPGDIGIGTNIVSDNNIKVHWPKFTAKQLKIGDRVFISNIYENTIILPIEISNLNNTININISYGICNGTTCIPLNKEISVDIANQEIHNNKLTTILTQHLTDQATHNLSPYKSNNSKSKAQLK